LIEYSTEKLVHFSCPDCKNWWSIGDWKNKSVMWCPHCGSKHDVFPKEIAKEKLPRISM